MAAPNVEKLFPFESASEQQTRALGHQFGLGLQPGDVVALTGDLGAGKTQFVKGIAEAFYFPPEDVSSPTFTIANEYDCSSIVLYHMDLYRLTNEAELLHSGIEEYLNAGGICLVEWPRRAEHLLPERTHVVGITHLPDGKRKLEYARLGST